MHGHLYAYSHGKPDFSDRDSFSAFRQCMAKNKERFRQHGIAMLIAVALQAVAIFAIMIRSFDVIIFGDFTVAVFIVTSVHGLLGILAEVLSVWIVASWRLRASIQYCSPKKPVMLLTLT